MSSSVTAKYDVVPATGVAEQDTANIKRALSAGGPVLLAGAYSLAEPITVTAPASLVGWPRAILRYAGLVTTSPAIAVHGVTAGSFASITGGRIYNLDLDCANLCRGMLFRNCWYTSPLISGVTIRRARTLGLDLDACYGSDIDNMQLLYCYGMSMRTVGCNSAHYQNVRIAGAGLYWHANADLTPALWQYAGDCGLAAARAKYGATQVRESWPSGLAVDDRACVAVLGATDLNRWTNVLFEPVHCADYPALLTRSHASTFSNVRFEGGHFYDAMMHVDGVDHGVRSGCNIVFDGVSVTSRSPAKSFAKLTGDTHGVEVRHLMAGAGHLRDSIVNAVGTGHVDVTVAHSRAFNVDGSAQLTDIVHTITP